MKDRITAYLKPTDYCNVGCSHCFLPEDVRANRHLMTMATLRQSAQLLADLAASRKVGVHVLFHGGEPLTVPLRWWDEAFAVLDEILPDRTQSIQTSLIPLRPDHLPMLKEKFGSVGSSLDFSQRTIKGSVEKYQELWMRKVAMAREAGVGVGVVLTPTRNDIGRARQIVDWVVERDFRYFNMNRYNAFWCPDSPPTDRPNNREHADFLWEAFGALMDTMRARGWSPLCGPVAGALTGVMYGIGGDRWAGTCMSNRVVIAPDGKLNNCPDKAGVEAPLGDVAGGCAAWLASPGRREWVRFQATGHQKPWCHGCREFSWCRSACPITPNALDTEGECSGYLTYLQRVRGFLADGAAKEMAESYLRQRVEEKATC